jgi:flagellar protein FliO/FliZ
VKAAWFCGLSRSRQVYVPFSLYLGGEKLKTRQSCHIKFYTVLCGLVLLGAGALGAQSPDGALTGADGGLGAADGLVADDAAAGGAADGAAAPGAAPDERTIRLGEGEAAGVPVAVPDPVSGFAIFRAVLLLVMAAAAVYGVVFAVKKLSRPREARSPHLRVLATTQLGPNRYVHVVALGTRGWLVGSGEGGISHIADIEEQEALDALFLEESRRAAQGAGPGDFRSLLRRVGIGPRPDSAGLPGAAAPGAEARDDGEIGALAENIRRRRDRLRGL